MKKIFTNLFAVFMAVLVFYGGAGVNIISYCCNDCRAAGIEALIHDKCCDIHHHNHDQDQDHNHESDSSKSCCNTLKDHSSDDNCNMERIDFDWNVQNADELKIELSPDVHNLFSDSFLNNSYAYLPVMSEDNTVMPKGPPLVLPRDYLSILTVLLI